MPHENVDLIRSVIDAISRGDIDAAAASVSPDFEADLSNSRGPAIGVYRGRDRIQGFMESFSQAWESLRWDPEEWIEVDDHRVLTVSRLQMRGHASGAEVNAKGASIWTVQDGEIVALTLYQSKAEALAAAGLRE